MYVSFVIADVYKFEDEHGRLTFTDQPCSIETEEYYEKSDDTSGNLEKISWI